MLSRQELLDQLIERIREEGSFILASPEDANYFRKTLTPKTSPPPPSPPPPKIAPPLPSGSGGAAPSSSAFSTPNDEASSGDPGCVLPSEISSGSGGAAPSSSAFCVLPSDIEFAALRQILKQVAPEMMILNEMPSDETARKIAERWKTKNQSAPISVLSYQEPPEQKALLEQLAKALDVYFGPAKIVQAETIEKEKQWGAFLETAGLKTILICDYALWQLNGLMHFYKETPAQGKRVLGNVPLFLLPDLSLYLKDPLLKRSLWKALCQKLS